MKKYAAGIIILLLCFLFVSCSNKGKTHPAVAASSQKTSSSSAGLDEISSAGTSSPSSVASSSPSSSVTSSPATSSPAASSSQPQAKQAVTVTIPPGYCVAQIAAMLETKGVCKESDFLSAVNSYGFTESIMSTIPNDPGEICYRLEGYLYPDTYQFYINMKPQDAIGKMLQDASTKIGSSFSYPGMTTAQVVTLASMIEKEAPDLTNMEKVSSVFHNRLTDPKDYPYLGSDATVFYLTVYIAGIDSKFGSDLVDKYKYYYNADNRVKGLPAGPICSPGYNALYAASHPAATNYHNFSSDASGNYSYS